MTCGFTVGLFDLVDCCVWLVLCFCDCYAYCLLRADELLADC